MCLFFLEAMQVCHKKEQNKSPVDNSYIVYTLKIYTKTQRFIQVATFIGAIMVFNKNNVKYAKIQQIALDVPFI